MRHNLSRAVGAMMKVMIMTRYYVEYYDKWNDHNQTYIYMQAKDIETIEKILIEYEIVTIETTE